MDTMIRFRSLSIVCVLAALAAAGPKDVAAQGWGWNDNPGRYSEPLPAYGQQQQQPVYGQQDYGPPRSAAPFNPRCRELELQLSGGGTANATDQLPRIEAEMRQADAQFHRAQEDAERANCYEDMFLFGRTLRRTPRCIDLDRQVQTVKAQLAQLKAQRDAILRGTSWRARHADLIAELARNHCGDQYVREYEAQRSRTSSIFSFFTDEDPDDTNRSTIPTYGASTYRTLCVRECDGFYFPVSTATTETQFQEDDAKCRSLCAAPAELFYHRTDQDVDQMISLKGVPYAQTPNAFRNRKVYIRGCSCNAKEYSREEIARSEEALRNAKRADASPGNKPAPDAAFVRRMTQAVQNLPEHPQTPPEAAPGAPPAANAPAPAETPPPAAPPAQ